MSKSLSYATTKRVTPEQAETLIGETKAAATKHTWTCAEGMPMWVDDDHYLVGSSKLVKHHDPGCDDFDVIASILKQLAVAHDVHWRVHIESKKSGLITADGPDAAALHVIATIDQKADH